MERRERTSLAKARMDLLADFFDGSGDHDGNGTVSPTKKGGDGQGPRTRNNHSGNPFTDEGPFIGLDADDPFRDPPLGPLYRPGNSTGAGRETGRVQVHSSGDPFGFQVEGT